MAAWIMMSLGMEVGLGPDDIVLDGDLAPPLQKGDRAPLPKFWPMSIVAKRLDGSRWHLACRWALVQATLCKTGNQLPKKEAEFPSFPPILIVAKLLDASRCHLVWR